MTGSRSRSSCLPWLIRRTYVLSGRRPKPDVSNLAYTQAHAPLPLPAGHTRMPPGPSETATELYMQGLLSPTSALSTEAGLPCRIGGAAQPPKKPIMTFLRSGLAAEGRGGRLPAARASRSCRHGVPPRRPGSATPIPAIRAVIAVAAVRGKRVGDRQDA